MSDSESEVDEELLAEEQRIREQFGLAASDDDAVDENAAANSAGDDAPGTGEDIAAQAIDDQIRKLETESENLQGERDLLKEQVGNFEDLYMAMTPVPGVDPSKFLETIMVEGREVVQDYRDVKIRDLSKQTKALNVKANSLREANEQKIKELANVQMQIDRIENKQARLAAQANAASEAGEESPRKQKLRKMRTAVEDHNRRIEMLNIRGENCTDKINACAAILRNELGLAPDAEIVPEAILAKGGPNARQRKKTSEELTMLQTEVRHLNPMQPPAHSSLTPSIH